MEGRMKKYYNREVSPERAKVWREKSPKYYQNQNKKRKVEVVYYLCRNRQLEHPHFIEVTLSSPLGLYLRDVMERLNVLRGRGMASMYSWSCKRSHKNGFVWHDLCDEDLILPVNGNEYVLKGSELFEESTSDRFASVGTMKLQNLRQLPEPTSSRSQDDCSSSSSMNGKDLKNSQEDELSPPARRPDSSNVSPQSGVDRISSGVGSLSLTEYKVYKSDGVAHASTQTEEVVCKPNSRETCSRGVSTDEDATVERERNETCQNQIPCSKGNCETSANSLSPPSSSFTASTSGGKTESLEALIRADVSRINSFKILENEKIRIPTNGKLKATNMLMQLISCGSISVKDHSFGVIPTYRPRFLHTNFPSPSFTTSISLGELDCLSENPRMMGLKLEDKEYFSGSLIETKKLKEGEGIGALKRSSSYNADRTSKELDSIEDSEETAGHSKCIPRSIKATLSKQPRGEPMRSPVCDKLRNSSDRADGPQAIQVSTSNGSSRRFIDPESGKRQHSNRDSFREESDKVIKIEERLASGARVIIQSKAATDTIVCS